MATAQDDGGIAGSDALADCICEGCLARFKVATFVGDRACFADGGVEVDGLAGQSSANEIGCLGCSLAAGIASYALIAGEADERNAGTVDRGVELCWLNDVVPAHVLRSVSVGPSGPRLHRVFKVHGFEGTRVH